MTPDHHETPAAERDDAAPAAVAARDAARRGRAVEAERAAPRRPGRLRAAGGLAAAAAMVLAVFAVERADRQRHAPWDGAGHAAPAPVTLRVLVEQGERLEQAVPGQEVAAAARLRFALELAREAQVWLVRVPAAGEPEVIHAAHAGAGRSAVPPDGGRAAYRLDGLAGAQRFVVVASEEALSPGDVIAAATGAGGGHGGHGGAAADAVEVTVR